MAGKAVVGGTVSVADFWFNSATKSLASHMFSAAHDGRSIGDVTRSIDAERAH